MQFANKINTLQYDVVPLDEALDHVVLEGRARAQVEQGEPPRRPRELDPFPRTVNRIAPLVVYHDAAD